MPEIRSHSKSDKNSQLFQNDENVNPGKQTNQGISSESSTKIYIGKKITDTKTRNTKQKLKDTTLTDFSIDTDYHDNKSVAINKNVPKITETTITNDEITGKHCFAHESSSLIIEDNVHEHSSIPPQGSKFPISIIGKKEKPLQQNLSLDITNSFLHKDIPTGKEHIPLGSGVIVGLLGTGGMAKVYRVWNEKLELYRAVKILMSSTKTNNCTRFQTEAKISAKLHHQNIVEVHSVGEWQGVPFIEMELVEGVPLSTLITDSKSLPSFVCSAIAVQIARALAYAHSLEVMIYGKTYKGIIHRDLKPSNVMVSKDGMIKLMDFGVARPIETGLHTIDTESIVGTVHYFSPEQIGGYPIDQLSDIYSFGSIVYEMLSGTNPFPQTEIVNLIRAKEKNHFCRLEDFQKPVDPRLMSVAQTCLRTDKKGRFQSATLLRGHLEEIHNSLKIGTPEEVVCRFFENPEKMIAESNHKYLYSRKNDELAKMQQTEVLIDEECETESLQFDSLPEVFTEDRSTYHLNEQVKKHSTIKTGSIITAAVLSILAIIAALLTK